MILEYPDGEIELRPISNTLDQTMARTPVTTPAGELVIVGDHGWDPATLTLTVRLNSSTTITPGDGALVAADALLAAAKVATCLREPPGPGARITYLHGLKGARRRHRGTWWEIHLGFLPRALDGTRGTGEALTYFGAVVTYGGSPVSVEVH